MRSCVLLFAIAHLALFGQTLVGTVQKIDKGQMDVKSPEGVVTFRTDERTTVAKLRKANDLSLLAVGDEVRINYYGEDTYTAVNISVRVSVTGTIAQSALNRLTLSEAGGRDRKSDVFVFLNAGAKLGVTRDQLKVGRHIRVTGWDTGDGIVEAEKIVVD